MFSIQLHFFKNSSTAEGVSYVFCSRGTVATSHRLCIQCLWTVWPT